VRWANRCAAEHLHDALLSTLTREKGGLVARAVQALLVAKVIVSRRSTFECCSLKWGVVRKDSMWKVKGRCEMVPGSVWGVVIWAFRIGLNQTAAWWGNFA
jgi:hypothetical protein